MTPLEREIALRKKAEKLARKGVQVAAPIEPAQEVLVISESTEALPEEPALKPRRIRGSHK